MAKNGGIKLRARAKNGTATVKVLMNHPMETGFRKDKTTGEKIPAHFIQEVTCEHNGKVVMTGLFGAAVSKNPYLSFKFTNAKSGDTLKISWLDNMGETEATEATIA